MFSRVLNTSLTCLLFDVYIHWFNTRNWSFVKVILLEVFPFVWGVAVKFGLGSRGGVGGGGRSNFFCIPPLFLTLYCCTAAYIINLLKWFESIILFCFCILLFRNKSPPVARHASELLTCSFIDKCSNTSLKLFITLDAKKEPAETQNSLL